MTVAFIRINSNIPDPKQYLYTSPTEVMEKNRFIIFCCFLYISPSFSQSVNWQWAKSSTGPGYQEGNSVGTDQDGNVYITGYFHGAFITFDSTTLLNAAYGNFYLA